MSDEPTPWCCDGFAAFCPLCADHTGATVRCLGHGYNDANAETVRVSRLHARFQHPDYAYRTTQGPRKQWENANQPPCDDNGNPERDWERNVDAGDQGWERFDYTEESYWRRRKPPNAVPSPITGACAAHHTDGCGNVTPCPGYPHAVQSDATNDQDTGRRCPRCDCPDGHEQCEHCKVCPHADSRGADRHPALTAKLGGAGPDDRLRAAEIRAAVAEHEAEAYRNQVQALVRELLRMREVPEEDLPQKVRVILLDEEAP